MARRAMVHLTTVGDAFHGRVVMARLGADGILAELRGAVGATYPLAGLVEIYVDAQEAEAARQLLLADAVDAVLVASVASAGTSEEGPGSPALDLAEPAPRWEPTDAGHPARWHVRWSSLVITILVLATALTYALGA